MRRHHPRARTVVTAFAVLVVAAGTPRTGTNAQTPARPVVKDDARAKIFEEMRQTAGAFKAISIDGDTRTPMPFVREPLHRWTDPTRDKDDGTLWAWRSSGRPIAIVAIEWHSIKPESWSFEFVSLSTGPVEASDSQIRWTPRKAGVSFREIPNAPPPAAGEAERLRQMRELLKRFSATEFWDVTHQDYVLRPLPHPIDRYADPASGLVDGAIFIFANGTNPEALVLIEARREANGATRWSYAAATLTTAAPTLRLDKKDVWTTPNKYGWLSNETYFFLETARNLNAPPPATKESRKTDDKSQ
jgi:hypothetical protein